MKAVMECKEQGKSMGEIRRGGGGRKEKKGREKMQDVL